MAASSPFSVVVTAYIDTSANDLMLVSKRSGFSSGTNLFSVSLGGNINAQPRCPAITKNGNYYVWGSPQIATSSWFNLVVVGDSTGTKCWVDGVAAGTTNQNTNSSVTSDWRSGAATSANLQVFSHSSGSNTWKGSILKVLIYDRALSDDEAISASNGMRAPLRGRTFTADLTRTARDLTNAWSATTVGSLTVQPNPRTYGLY